MAIQLWNGGLGTGILVETLPIPASLSSIFPPTHKVTIPGPLSLVTIFTEAQLPGSYDYGYLVNVDNIRYTPPDPEPAIEFDALLPQQTRVLTHNYGAYPYPSQLQTEDGAIRVWATVRVNNQPAAGKTIHFRLIDPPDTAPYVRHAGDDTFGDNADGPGSLDTPGQTTATAVSDGAGRVSVTLRATSYAAGDNYQIEASGSENFGCGLSCAKSAVYTAWKRVYVEYNKMFRRGAYITLDVLPGVKRIAVSNVNQFPTPPFTVRLFHAPRFATGGTAFHSETVVVTRVVRNGLPFGVTPGALHLDPSAAVPGVQHPYFAGEAVGQAPGPRTYLADAVGLVTGDRHDDYFLLDSRHVGKMFGDAFVEFVWLSDSIAGIDNDLASDDLRLAYDGVLPHDSMIDAPPDGHKSDWLTRKWMRHAQRVGQDRLTHPNHFIVFTATNHPRDNAFNRVGSGFNDLWLFVRQMGNAALAAESLVHEMAHEWRVNGTWQPGVPHTGSSPKGHCDVAFGRILKIYNRELKCAMTEILYGDASEPERNDGIVGFHYVRTASGQPDSEYLRIRHRQEPVPQNDQQRPAPQ